MVLVSDGATYNPSVRWNDLEPSRNRDDEYLSRYDRVTGAKDDYAVFRSNLPGKWSFKALPYDKILDKFKLKELADDKIDKTQKLKFVLRSKENIVGKGENCGYQHFLLFPTMFSKTYFLRVVKSPDCVVKS